MMVMTAKVDKKKILLILAAAALILALLLMLPDRNDAQNTAGDSLATNDARVEFLKSLGWEVAASPVESGQVRIPEGTDEVFTRYNELQKSQGYDLTPYAGKTAARYVYQVKNYPGATDPVYVTLLIRKDQIIGGDITDTSPKGAIRPLGKSGTPDSTKPTLP